MRSLRPLQDKVGIQTGGRDLRVSLDDAGEQVVVDFLVGRCVSIDTDTKRPAELYLRSAVRGLIDAVTTFQQAADLHPVDVSINGIDFTPMPPFGLELPISAGRELLGATLQVQHMQINSPVGPVYFTDFFEAGEFTLRRPGFTPGSSVVVRSDFYLGMTARLAEPGLLPALTMSHVACRTRADLLLAAALYQACDVRAQLLQRADIIVLLCALAEHLCAPGWRA